MVFLLFLQILHKLALAVTRAAVVLVIVHPHPAMGSVLNLCFTVGAGNHRILCVIGHQIEPVFHGGQGEVLGILLVNSQFVVHAHLLLYFVVSNAVEAFFPCKDSVMINKYFEFRIIARYAERTVSFEAIEQILILEIIEGLLAA